MKKAGGRRQKAEGKKRLEGRKFFNRTISGHDIRARKKLKFPANIYANFYTNYTNGHDIILNSLTFE
ncbi:MAG: hypothetical protein F6K24_35880 [Okeania sp. SIO2D1]|nr:hypothetical protein [Okeania sp. SIO2D1]